MKKIWMGLILLAGFNSFAQQITVRSEQAEDVDFTKFKTFDWSTQIDNKLDEGLYFLSDLVLKAQVRDAVEAELMGLGYRHLDENPDLVVNFRVFDKATTIKGGEGYGDDYWGNDVAYTNINEEQSTEVEAGTLLISLADRQNGQVVWQGFASGLIDNDRFIKDEVKISEAVNLVFEDYGQRAREYSRK